MSAQGSGETLLAWHMPWGMLDMVDADSTGLIRVFGWSYASSKAIPAPRLRIGHRNLEVHKFYRTPRPDVPAAPSQLLNMPGFVFEYLVPAPHIQDPPGLAITIEADGKPPKCLELRPFLEPMHYGDCHYQLLHSRRVFGRQEVYGYGAPLEEASPDVLALAEATSGNLLDFGCGAGALVAALRGKGRDAVGVELDRPAIRAALRADAVAHVKLYDGAFPMPFEAKSFDVVMATEVIEHIPDYAGAVAEIARVCRGQALLTVPDMSAIPLGYRHGLVPWHLLESTHVNFFTQESLAEVLKPHFSRVTFGRIGMSRINETIYFVSLVASCEV